MELDQSAVSIDVVALRFWPDDGQVTFGIARRPRGPYEGRRALPGVLLGLGARLEGDARRAVTEKLGVPADHILAVGQLVTFDEPNRDPRGPTLSIAMWAVIGQYDGDTLAQWVPFDDHPRLAFDHDQIVATSRGLLAGKLWRDLAFTRALTGEAFPATRAVSLTATLTATRPDPGNLNRTLAGIEGLERTDERTRVRATGRPAAVWRWVTPP
ncbi:NUDIX hydrolase [Tenggerimyces flavus]|uniref:NUDIX hydrolase n=1 Tax=Tenggerimyces flavus TaxID=1708749 RepID=A0ABV7Y7Y8_9ACTN|nr:NUDIX hydrolase [Tenggerimyces flavus]MBM7788286.1 ADP-ribose pyrophosphatase YjhB (NUDIX family) [Tenggerimyces flavus]